MIASKYNPAEVEEKWYRCWMQNAFFQARPIPGKTPYTIVIPPPNVTGVLHMGHMLNNTIQDVLIRKARMEGKEACWVPGTDHASIATEARVVSMLRERGVKKSDLTREEFLKYAWEWKEKYGGLILEQLKKLGASCDWSRTHFTMDEAYSKAVIRVFTDLYRKGKIYRGMRMINWDCEAKTALSNEEVIYREGGEKSRLYSIRYALEGSSDFIVIATQRPETIFGDVAIAVNPSDERYKHLTGKKALVPFINRPIPIIADDYVDKEFGTGCLKVTPANDVNDYEIGLRHQLPVIDTLREDGTLNEKSEMPKYVGKGRFVVRAEVVKDLREAGLLEKEEEFVTRIGRSERTNSVVEPRLSLQWFIKMKEISARAKEAVEKDEIKLYPSKFKNTYRHWMDNVRDWCISRQLWWGHRIPAYFYGNGENDFVVAESREEALTLAQEKSGKNLSDADLRQDSDVLDTWASSWLWPIEVFEGFSEACYKNGKIDIEKNATLNYFYPTDVLVTAPEILFFWVARMIIAGYLYMDEKPFKDVYLTGIVRDKKGKKMSKSLGNSPDPLDLIAAYGADGVRTGMLFASPAGNDLLFDEKLCEQGRNFCNKIWNAFRLVKGWRAEEIPTSEGNKAAAEWFLACQQSALADVEDHFSKYRIADALHVLYKWAWDDFCARYLEIVKPEYEQPIDAETFRRTIQFFETVLKVLHPFMPFITEELWHSIKPREDYDCLIIAPWPERGEWDAAILEQGNYAFEVASQVRNARNANGLSPKELLTLHQPEGGVGEKFLPIVSKLANVKIENSASPGPHISFMTGTQSFFIPLEKKADEGKEREETEKELAYQKGFLASVMNKLDNEKFMGSAPPKVVETERQKKADAEKKIAALEEKLMGNE